MKSGGERTGSDRSGQQRAEDGREAEDDGRRRKAGEGSGRQGRELGNGA
ncbi:hypothetical protein [Cohnella fermenti]|nr:hypothetical protein [Cohnella fermenti]